MRASKSNSDSPQVNPVPPENLHNARGNGLGDADQNGGNGNGHAAADEPANPFDLKALRSRLAAGPVGAVKAFAIDVHKPKSQIYFRVNPGEDYILDCFIFDSKATGASFWVAPGLWDELQGLTTGLINVRIFTCVTKQGDYFLWPVRLSDDGRKNGWYSSALENAETAKSKWIRVEANMGRGAYDRWEADPNNKWPAPSWPEKSLQELIELAFKDSCITTLEHFAIVKLLGADK